jgi:hypothetical protein
MAAAGCGSRGHLNDDWFRGVVDSASAAPDAAGPTGYTTVTHYGPGIGGLNTCQLGRVDDLGAGGDVEPIGPIYDNGSDGCPWDLAVRDESDGQARLWAVVQPFDELMATAASTSTAPSALGHPLGALNPDATIAADDGSVLVTIDPTTGVRTTVGPLGFASLYGGLAFDVTGTLWYYAQNLDPECLPGEDSVPFGVGQCLYRLDLETGAAQLAAQGPAYLTTAGVQTWVTNAGMASTCDDVLANVWRIDGAVNVTGLNHVNTATGDLSPLPNDYGATAAAFGMGGIEHGAKSEELWGIGGSDVPGGDEWATYRIDPSTGAFRKIADLTGITTVGPDDDALGLAIAGLSCEDPVDPVNPPTAVDLEPNFAG